jgi:hypothetical protein
MCSGLGKSEAKVFSNPRRRKEADKIVGVRQRCRKTQPSSGRYEAQSG